ncbi:DNA-processing protein DprA [Proteus cibi]|uniref:DNA-processing protein DprA n=1 Tax=Proteus cibi TaxID=2050966 RepID=UPI001E38AFD8|nr:DNA-processing protein DprA [Proteus cibi]
MIISSSTKLLLTLSMLKGVGPVFLKKIAFHHPSLEELTLSELSKSDAKLANILNAYNELSIVYDKVEEQIEYAEKNNFRILSILDNEYPALLAKTNDDPCILYVKGNLSSFPEKSVAVIGTREPTNHGSLIAERITTFFVEQNWSIVSGLAIGCDTIAHKTALDNGGHTVAILAHGLQTIAPRQNEKLANRILEQGGALITEYPFGQEIQRAQYVKRDRIQAGLSRGVVMIQSDIKGGSLHASRASLDYDRWLAVPYPTDVDYFNNEPKIQANLLIANGSDNERLKLLRCANSKLNNIIILKEKKDYQKLIDDSFTKIMPMQTSFIDDMFSETQRNNDRNVLSFESRKDSTDIKEDRNTIHKSMMSESEKIIFIKFNSDKYYHDSFIKYRIKNIEEQLKILMDFESNTKQNLGVKEKLVIECILFQIDKILKELITQGKKSNFIFNLNRKINNYINHSPSSIIINYDEIMLKDEKNMDVKYFYDILNEFINILDL